ncbi:hypothetical protein [Nocardia alni]|uniref:hypothetical protein n=1 Tax=Nocardia alni TaxID=2815723 RepID=UPI001C216ABF|nr:hypothetical protein [Nocardia alni]
MKIRTVLSIVLTILVVTVVAVMAIVSRPSSRVPSPPASRVSHYASNSSESAPSTTTDRAQQQAQAVSSLLGQIVRTRSQVLNAVQQEVLDCEDVDQGVNDLQQGMQNRSRELQIAQSLDIDALTGGSQLKTDLVAALHASYDADQSYALWGQNIESSGCSAPAKEDNDFDLGNTYSTSASKAKISFVADWQPIASIYGLPAPTPQQI